MGEAASRLLHNDALAAAIVESTQILAETFVTIFVVLYYFDLRLRPEALDLVREAGKIA